MLSPEELRGLLEEAGDGGRRERLRAARQATARPPAAPAAYLAQLSSVARMLAPFRSERPRPQRLDRTFKL